MTPTVLWWGRFDPTYSRNQLLMRLFRELGWRVAAFRPAISRWGDWQARLSPPPLADLVWVPAFRQRDLVAALRWAARHRLPLVADPLISAYDKAVGERHKYPPGSRAAERLRRWEGGLLAACDRVVADTEAHAAYFAEVLGVPPQKLHVIVIGADSTYFTPQPLPTRVAALPEALFYGSFIALQRPETIVRAAAHYQGPPARWTLLGEGPLRAACERLAAAIPLPPQLTLTFESALPYRRLPQRAAQAHAILGVFGASEKAARVIPNKVAQGLALGRAVVTRESAAYPAPLRAAPAEASGIVWVPPEAPAALAEALAALWRDPARLAFLGERATQSYDRYLSDEVVRAQLVALLASLGLPYAPSSARSASASEASSATR